MDSVFGKWEKRRCSQTSKIVSLGLLYNLLILYYWKRYYSETWWEETPTQVTISTPSSHIEKRGIFLTKLILHGRYGRHTCAFKNLQRVGKLSSQLSGKMQILAPWWKTCKPSYFWGRRTNKNSRSFSSLQTLQNDKVLRQITCQKM